MTTKEKRHAEAGARLIVVANMLAMTQHELSDAQIATVRGLIDDLINYVNRTQQENHQRQWVPSEAPVDELQ